MLAESQMALTAACVVSGEEGVSSERSAPWASSWGKLVEVEREQAEWTQDPLTRGDPQLLSPLSNHSRNPTAPPKWPRSNLGAGGGVLRHSPFFSAMAQKWVLQAWETAGFCSTEQPTAGRPPARHCTDRVCTPPPQVAVHCGRHELPSRWATRPSSHPFLWAVPSSQAPQGGLSLSLSRPGWGAKHKLHISQVWTLGRRAQESEYS